MADISRGRAWLLIVCLISIVCGEECHVASCKGAMRESMEDESSLLALGMSRAVSADPHVVHPPFPPPPPLPTSRAVHPPTPGMVYSWSVTPVSLPSALGILPDPMHWWYWAGKAEGEDGKQYGIFLHVDKITTPQGDASGVYFGLAVPGGEDGQKELTMEATAFGPGVTENANEAGEAALFVPRVTHDKWSIQHKPSAPTGAGRGLSWEYDSKASGAAAVGEAGAVYNFHLSGIVNWTNAAPVDPSPAQAYSVDIVFEDKRGVVLTGTSFGKAEMDIGTSLNRPSWEWAMPMLEIRSGTLMYPGASGPTRLKKGWLWLDMQNVQPSSDGQILLSHDLSLYEGTWINIKFDCGVQLQVWNLWEYPSAAGKQWISGSMVGRPARVVAGTVIFPLDGLEGGDQGGVALWSDADFDLNILNPDTPEQSPHFVSPDSNRTYAFAWQVKLNVAKLGRFAAKVPPIFYVFPKKRDGSSVPEMKMLGGSDKFSYFSWLHGDIYADRNRGLSVGDAWIEQWMN